MPPRVPLNRSAIVSPTWPLPQAAPSVCPAALMIRPPRPLSTAHAGSHPQAETAFLCVAKCHRAVAGSQCDIDVDQPVAVLLGKLQSTLIGANSAAVGR